MATRIRGATNPTSNAFGQSFSDWLRDFWAYNWGGVGQQVQQNNVMFMPIPTPAEWQDWSGKNIGIGTMDLTVKPGTKLVLGVLAWIGETYQNHDGVIGSGAPDDPPWTKDLFEAPNAESVIMVDGVSLMTTETMGDFYYGPAYFKEPIWYAAASSYGSTGAIYVQGTGIVIPPLSAGKHTLTLYSWSGPFGNVGWFNTWNITVEPPGKK